MTIVGIDLAGSIKRNTGIACSNPFIHKIVHTDQEILAFIDKCKAKYVGIDAPLSLPPGRKTIEDKGEHFRKPDLELKRMGIRFFPITLGPMRMLTKRGINMAKKLRKKGINVFEVYPGAFYDILGVNRKDKQAIKQLFNSYGYKTATKQKDELDAIAALITVELYLKGKARNIGNNFIVPLKEKEHKGND